MPSCTTVHKTASGYYTNSSPFDGLIEFWVSWQIPFLMIITMSLQLLLVLAGFCRKHTSSPALHGSVWIAFLSLDTFAAYALGLMLASGCDYVFSLYSPILLFHLGAADSINAYASTDNDLWRRYGFRMLLETIAAAYIVSRSADCPNFTAASVLLYIVGAFKYGERIFALGSGCQAQILASARPIYRYMSLHGENHHDLIVSGDEEWYKEFTMNGKITPRDLNTVVMFEDIKKCHSLLKLMGHGIIEHLCLAYALYKVFRRRIANLHIHQKEEDFVKVKQALLKLKADDIRMVIDLELSFIFDGIFSKGSAGRLYQGIGVLSRLLSAIFLFAAALEIFILDQNSACQEATPVPFALGLANLLVVVAFMIECVQIYKLMRSNWLRVWLACNYITEMRLAGANCSVSDSDPYQRNVTMTKWKSFHNFNQKAISYAFRHVGNPKTSHWNFKLEQLSIFIDSLNVASRHYLCHFDIGLMCDVQNIQLKIRNLVGEVDMAKMQSLLVDKTIQRYETVSASKDLTKLRLQIRQNLWPDEFELNDLFSTDPRIEDIILSCHLFTSVFEVKLLSTHVCSEICEDHNVKMSIGLSRYCMHLMIKRPKLMPEDPDVARGLYNVVKDQLNTLFLTNMKPSEENVFALIRGNEDLDCGSAMLVASRTFLNMPVAGLHEMAARLVDMWVDVLIYVVLTAENAYPHIEQMAKGGELLTHLWVLLGHIAPCNYLGSPRQ